MASKMFDLSLVQYFWTCKAKGFLCMGFLSKSYVLKKSWYVKVVTRGDKAGVKLETEERNLARQAIELEYKENVDTVNIMYRPVLIQNLAPSALVLPSFMSGSHLSCVCILPPTVILKQ